ncbi:MAG: sulfatase-like hydrolase/transferase, partial [Opitutae bacterium]|nr:sulfatase-like hydrolase/transferase [Opitutae bacterium]
MLSLKKSALWTCALTALSALHAVAAETRPNIVFFLSDDQPLRAMSHVDPWFHTPNMDRLAEEGVVFENGFVESSVCAVSRA